MNRTKRLRGPCQHCGASLEFAAEMVGTTAQCPYCGKVTELNLAVPRLEAGLPARVIVWTIIAVLILLGGLAGSLYALKKTQALVRDRKPPATELLTNPPPTR